MKIVLLTGSPRKNGNSSYLADQFIKGAKEAGHSVFRFDSAFHKVSPCKACNSCRMDGPCVFKDDFDLVRQQIIDADMVAFATPMYYFGISAQLKCVIDRFHQTYANSSPKDVEAMLLHYRTLYDYLGWKDMGTVVASGVWNVGDIIGTEFGEQAYRLWNRHFTISPPRAFKVKRFLWKTTVAKQFLW